MIRYAVGHTPFDFAVSENCNNTAIVKRGEVKHNQEG